MAKVVKVFLLHLTGRTHGKPLSSVDSVHDRAVFSSLCAQGFCSLFTFAFYSRLVEVLPNCLRIKMKDIQRCARRWKTRREVMGYPLEAFMRDAVFAFALIFI